MSKFSDFPLEEYQRRSIQARKLMGQYGIDALFLTDEENMTYFSGFRKILPTSKARGYILNFMLLPKEGEPVLILPLPMRGNAEISSWIKDQRFFASGVTGMPEIDPIQLAVETIEELGVFNKVIGLELGEQMRIAAPQKDFDAIRSKLSNANLVDASELIWKMRMIKSPREIQYVEKACDITCKAFQAGFESIKEDMTEKELARIIYKAMLDEGGEDTPLQAVILVRSGPDRYRLSDTRPSETKIKKGHIVIVDGGVSYKGYASDICRLASIGKPTKKQMEMSDCAFDADEACLRALKPNVKASDIFRAADDTIRDHGYSNNFIYRFCGHGIGLSVHEPPSIAEGIDIVLRPGMVLCFEPVLYDTKSLTYVLTGRMKGRGEEGVFYVEDQVVVTETGCQNLTSRMKKTLWIV